MSEQSSLLKLAENIARARVLCVGDVMLDRFISGDVERISPEAPIPILRIENETTMLGGAGNVARNISSLGGAVHFISVTGDDQAGREIDALLQAESEIEINLIVDSARQTSQKSRFVAGTQQVLRADKETIVPVTDNVADQIVQMASRAIGDCGALMLSDYGKGVLSDDVIARLIELAIASGTPVIVDPKGNDYSCYKGATLVTPNRKELEQAAGMTARDDKGVIAAANKLISTCGIGGVLATRSADGMSLVMKGEEPKHLAAEARDVFDVSGAGDTVAATLSAGIAANGDLPGAAMLANAAAGIVVAKVGTASVGMAELIGAITSVDPASTLHPVFDDAGALRQVKEWQQNGLSVGFTNGCFDILHNGHRSLLQQAGDVCDRLIVALNTDASVQKLKGPDRPVNTEDDRALLLSSLRMVDAVILFDDETPLRLIEMLKPNVLIKGADYEESEIVGADLVKANGGHVVRARLMDGLSTTATIERMRGGTG